VKFRKTTDPSTSVEIYIQGQQPDRIQTTAPEFVTIMGQKIQTYGSWNEILAFATQPFLLIGHNGKSSYYAIEFTGDALYKSRAIPQFGW
jgi:hypothetical protein